MSENDSRGRGYVRRINRRKQRIRRTVSLVTIITALLIFIINITNQNSSQGNPPGTEAIVREEDVELFPEKKETGNEEVPLTFEIDRPVSRSEDEVLERIRELGEISGKIKDIYEKYFMYPPEMLAALANNPEMADFVLGYLEEEAVKSEESGFTKQETEDACLTKQEKEEAYPLFLQWDKRWGYHEYGNSNIGLCGCGPTCLSMVLYYLTRNEKYTPDYVADYSMQNGYYVNGIGTSWELMLEYPKKCGLHVEQPALMENKLMALLDKGHIIICAMGRGDFTSAGHFIVIYGYDETGFLVNDPNCIARSQRTWTFDELKWQIRSIWAYR